MIPTPEHPSSPLHVSQKFFWFSAAISLLVGTTIFSWQVFRGEKSSVELGSIKFTTEQAAHSVAATKDQLLAIRTRLDDAAQGQDLPAIQDVLPDIDGLLKTLGVAEAALKRQQASPLLNGAGLGIDTYWTAGEYGTYYYPTTTPTPRKRSR
jgi:hypothetical protein